MPYRERHPPLLLITRSGRPTSVGRLSVRPVWGSRIRRSAGWLRPSSDPRRPVRRPACRDYSRRTWRRADAILNCCPRSLPNATVFLRRTSLMVDLARSTRDREMLSAISALPSARFSADRRLRPQDRAVWGPGRVQPLSQSPTSAPRSWARPSDSQPAGSISRGIGAALCPARRVTPHRHESFAVFETDQ